MSDYIIITGVIVGDPELYSYVRSCEIIFALELTSAIPKLKKKIGDIIVVHYSSHYITYVREGDSVELLGKVHTRHLKHKDVTVSYIVAHQLFNETLQFSLDY